MDSFARPVWIFSKIQLQRLVRIWHWGRRMHIDHSHNSHWYGCCRSNLSLDEKGYLLVLTGNFISGGKVIAKRCVRHQIWWPYPSLQNLLYQQLGRSSEQWCWHLRVVLRTMVVQLNSLGIQHRKNPRHQLLALCWQILQRRAVGQRDREFLELDLKR